MNRALIAVLCVAMLLQACTSINEVAPSRDALMHQLKIQPGDEIMVHKRDGTTVSVVVRRITDEAVVGRDHAIPFMDITTVEKQEGKKSTDSAGTVLIVFLMVATTVGSAFLGYLLGSQVFGF